MDESEKTAQHIRNIKLELIPKRDIPSQQGRQVVYQSGSYFFAYDWWRWNYTAWRKYPVHFKEIFNTLSKLPLWPRLRETSAIAAKRCDWHMRYSPVPFFYRPDMSE